MPAPRTSAPSTTTGSDALLYLLFGILGIALAFGSLAWLTGNLSNSLFGDGAWAPFRATDALLHPDAMWPHLSPTTLLVGARIIPGLLSVCLTILGLVLWIRLRGGAKNGLARKADLAPLLDKQITAKAKDLRPSLSDRERKRGRSGRPRHPARHSLPRAGQCPCILGGRDRRDHGSAKRKTSGLAIPAILAAPGPVLLTSNKAANDAFTATVDARAEVGTVWTLDPQQIAHHPREMWWDILADARDLAGAKRLAGHFVAASVDESNGSDFWSTAASNTLGALFLAAASHRRPITDVLAWLASPADRTPVDLLTDAGHDAVAAQLSRGRPPSTAARPPGPCAPARLRPSVCLAPPSLLPLRSHAARCRNPVTTTATAGPFPGRGRSPDRHQFTHGRRRFPKGTTYFGAPHANVRVSGKPQVNEGTVQL